jgi:hypothetical protein
MKGYLIYPLDFEPKIKIHLHIPSHKTIALIFEVFPTKLEDGEISFARTVPTCYSRQKLSMIFIIF